MATVVRRKGKSSLKLLKGKQLADQIKRLSRNICVDLSKADYTKARRILKDQSLSNDLIRMRSGV